MEYDLQSQNGNPIIPLFLLKTYSILETADPALVCWSEAGDSFLVKDPEGFSSVVIPTHFKHNKFSSFVRQLNFYGFRKVKGKLNFVGMSEQHSWEFKHPYFLRGQQDLMTHIKRSAPHSEESSSAAAALHGPKVVEGLQQQVQDLTTKMALLTKSVEDMQNIISNYQMKEMVVGVAKSLNNSVVAVPEPVVTEAAPVQPAVQEEEVDWDIGDDELLMTFLEDLNDGPLPPMASSPVPMPSLKRARSLDDISSFIEEQPATQVARTSQESVVQAVASAVALSVSDTDGGAVAAAREQYIAAVAAILSCAGMTQTQALATSAAVMSQTTAIKNQNDIHHTMTSQQMQLLA